jgi:hypothetical protein
MKYFLPLLCLISIIAHAKTSDSGLTETAYTLEGFVENKGQVTNQQYKPNDQVKFIFSQGLFNLQLKTDGFSYELFQTDRKKEMFEGANKLQQEILQDGGEKEDEYSLHSERIDVKFVGANDNSSLIATIPTGVSLNYYTPNTGENGITDVHSFYQVLYKNIYPGIDLKFSSPEGENKSLKYEWIIHPGADINAIKLKYLGAKGLVPTTTGSVNILTAKGLIEEGKLYSYYTESGEEAYVSYGIKNNVINYVSRKKRNDQTLVIDPNIAWFSYYGGNYNEDLFEGEMGVDQSGNILLAGNTYSTQYIASTGAYQVTYGGFIDGFVAKFKSSGKLAWATYYGSYSRDGAHAVAADAAGNVFMGGNTFSETGISTPGSHQPVFGGSMDAIFVKFNSNGIRQWATYFGGAGYGDQINSLACDAFGNLYFTGYTASFEQIATPGAYQENLNGVDDVTGDVMVGEFTNNGVLRWCSYLSGPKQDRGHNIALSNDGTLYIQGTCESHSQFASSGIHQSEYGGGILDGFISKWDTTGNFLWCSYYGGKGEEHGRGLATDAAGNAYMSGWTNSINAIATPGAFQEEWFPAYDDEDSSLVVDAFLAKFKPDGALAWGTYLGGEDIDRGRAIAVDKEAKVLYFIGQTESAQNVATNCLFSGEGVNDKDGFVAKFKTTGEQLWSYYVGGSGDQIVFDADLDPSNFLYLYTMSDEPFFTSSDVYQPTSHGGDEVMLIRMNPSDSCYDRFEPNDDKTTAKNLSTSKLSKFYGYTAAISHAQDKDWFRVKIASTNLKIELSDLPADYDLYLYKSGGQLISSSTNSGISEETIIVNNAPQGQYYIKVQPANQQNEQNACYRLTPKISDLPWQLKPETNNSISEENGLQVSIYPNPIVDKINIKMTSETPETIQATLYNLVGESMMSSTFIADQATQSFSMAVDQLPTGMYLLNVQTSGRSKVVKILIQH